MSRLITTPDIAACIKIQIGGLVVLLSSGVTAQLYQGSSPAKYDVLGGVVGYPRNFAELMVFPSWREWLEHAEDLASLSALANWTGILVLTPSNPSDLLITPQNEQTKNWGPHNAMEWPCWRRRSWHVGDKLEIIDPVNTLVYPAKSPAAKREPANQ